MNRRVDLGVIESRWWRESNDSVRGLFDVLAGIHVDNPFGYHYEMFNNTESIKEIIGRIAADPAIHHLYIAAHGSAKGISGAGDNVVRHDVLGRMLSDLRADRLYGVYMGCCEIGVRVEELINNSGLTWLAGYTCDVDWVSSSVMDLLFWDIYLSRDVSSSKRQRYNSMIGLLRDLYVRVPFMFVELGFKVALSQRKGDCVLFPDDVVDLDELQIDWQKYVRAQ